MIYFMEQNNSGGTFDTELGYKVFTHAESQEQAEGIFSNHISLCENDGSYGAYDNCGCCPCCGHRWGGVDSIEPSQHTYYTNKEEWFWTDDWGLGYAWVEGDNYTLDTPENIYDIVMDSMKTNGEVQ